MFVFGFICGIALCVIVGAVWCLGLSDGPQIVLRAPGPPPEYQSSPGPPYRNPTK